MIRTSLPQFEEYAGVRRVKYARSIDKIANIPPSEREKLRRVAKKYVFRAND